MTLLALEEGGDFDVITRYWLEIIDEHNPLHVVIIRRHEAIKT